MKKYQMLVAVVCVALAMTPMIGYCGSGDDLIETIGNGKVNWSDGTIRGKGIGAPPKKYYGKPNARPMAIRAAKLDALRNLLEVINGVRISSDTTVEKITLDKDIIQAKVHGMVRGAEEIKTQYMSDGTVEVMMQVKMTGGFAQLILPQDIKQVDTIKPITPTTAPPGKLTGLVVDARGLGAKPAMAPKIIAEDGNEVYGSAFVSREIVVQQGMSGYFKTIEAAQRSPRVADNPLIVKGLRTAGPGKCDIVISNADAARLRKASEHLAFLKKCRVIIVTD